jgi:hypothetical protein
LSQLQTDLFTAEIAGQKENPKEISADNPKNKNPALRRVFCFPKKKRGSKRTLPYY